MLYATLVALLPILSVGTNYVHVKNVSKMLVQGGIDRGDKYSAFEVMGGTRLAELVLPDALMATILLAGELADDVSEQSQNIRKAVRSSCREVILQSSAIVYAGEALLRILQRARLGAPEVPIMDVVATTSLAKFFSVCDVDIASLSGSQSGARLVKLVIRSDLQRSLGGLGGLVVRERTDAISIQLTSQRDRLLYEMMLYEPVELVSGATKFSSEELSRMSNSVFRRNLGNGSFFHYDSIGSGSLKLIEYNGVMQRYNPCLKSITLVKALYVAIGRLLAMAALFDVRIIDPLESSLIDSLLNDPSASTKVHLHHVSTGFQQILPLSVLRVFSGDSNVLSNLLNGPPSVKPRIGPAAFHV